jgi:hypothetical protein
LINITILTNARMRTAGLAYSTYKPKELVR